MSATNYDPDKIIAALELDKAKVKKIQMRTLCWDDPAEMKRHMAANPEIGEVFINLVRSELEARV